MVFNGVALHEGWRMVIILEKLLDPILNDSPLLHVQTQNSRKKSKEPIILTI